MKRTAILLFVATLLAACGSSPLTPPTPTPAPTPGPPPCKQSTIDALSQLHTGLKLPQYLYARSRPSTESIRRPAEEFDVNQTFSVLTRLSMEPGYTLDYVYYVESIGGEPILYARSLNQAPYLSYPEFYTATGITISSPQRDVYLEHVRTDGTAEGFFELALFHLMGDQFYLYWHAGYNDAAAICDQDGLESLISYLPKDLSGQKITVEQVRTALGSDLAPAVAFQGDTVTVRFAAFSRWKGVLLETFAFQREFPHKLMQRDEVTRVKYQYPAAF